MRDDDEDGGETVNAMDLLVPGVGEFAGGSQREERLDVLLKKMDDQENLRIKTWTLKTTGEIWTYVDSGRYLMQGTDLDLRD